MVDGKFDTKKLFRRISIFSSYKGTYRTKLSYADSGHSKTTLENSSNMKVDVTNSSIILRSKASYKNAILLGSMIKSIQYALFIDIPQKTIQLTDKILFDELIAQMLTGKHISDKSFSNIFKHHISFDSDTRELVYSIKI